METIAPQQWLSLELTEKKLANPRYSLRLLAKRSGIPPGRMSELLSGQRPITAKQAMKIADGLGLSFSKRQAFLRLIDNAGKGSKADVEFKQLSADAFHVVADWYHFAILSLMDLDDFQMSPEWIANRLALPKSTVEQALKRLKNLKLIGKVDGMWRKTNKRTTTTHDVPSVALRMSHKQSLQQAMDALDEIPVELRDVSSITMAIDPKSIPIVKNLIKLFRRKISTVMEAGQRSEVYNLNIQLVPVTKMKKVKHEN